MLRCLLRTSPLLAALAMLPPRAVAQTAASASSGELAEVRETVRRYDAALRRADVAAVERFFAPEYTFVNARGERLTRAERLANLRTGRTAFDSLAHAPREEQIRRYGDVVVYTTLLTLGGRYSGRAQAGQYRALVVWIRRDGRWQHRQPDDGGGGALNDSPLLFHAGPTLEPGRPAGLFTTNGTGSRIGSPFRIDVSAVVTD